jgi:hypothetical protein
MRDWLRRAYASGWLVLFVGVVVLAASITFIIIYN